jgi:hypothetical protein
MNNRRTFFECGLALLTLSLTLCAPSFGRAEVSPTLAATQQFTTLQPGQFREISQHLRINIVFVGYQRGPGPADIDEAAFRALLPNNYRAVNRDPRYYGIDSPAGLRFTYDYNIVYANSAFEDAFFEYLGRIATASPVGFYQELYNRQVNNSLEIDSNYTIDATAAETWLADHAERMIRVNTQEYTVFFVNWYGRPDFKFHTYVVPENPDPDTGHNFGLDPGYETRGWGGTSRDDDETGAHRPRRVWYLDLSAGPTELDWDVDDPDFVGWGKPQYRMPPIWDYGSTSGYRPFDSVSTDLGLITRFAAINELFTSSPAFKVAITPPRLPSEIQLDLNLYQADPEVDGRTMIDESLLVRNVSRLQPFNKFTSELDEVPFAGEAEAVFRCLVGSGPCPPNVFNSRYYPIYLYHTENAGQFLDGDADYEVPIYAYTAADSLYGPDGCSCSFAFDNWADGTQTMIIAQMREFWRERGFGLTRPITHEVGHHLGLSHPHDGYDSQLDEDYYGSDRFYAYYGAFSATVMQNGPLNTEFSQFDRDNMNRFMTAAYLNQANNILPLILENQNAHKVMGRLMSADRLAENSLIEHGRMNYDLAVRRAKQAFQSVITAADEIGVSLEPTFGQERLQRTKATKFLRENLGPGFIERKRGARR